MKCVGIDIGTSSVKIAEVEISQKGQVITGFRDFPFNPDPLHDPHIDIIDIIRSATAGFDPNTTKYVFSVPQNFVSVKHKTFPFRERQKILKSLPFELEDETPLDQDEAIFDAKIIAHEGAAVTEVLACICPKEQISKVLSLAKDCGIDPDIVGVEGVALANLFEDFLGALPDKSILSTETSDSAEQDSEPTEFTNTGLGKLPSHLKPAELVVHMGHTHTILLAFVNQRLIAVRSLAWGAKYLTELVAKKYKITYLEALRELQKKSFLLTRKDGATRDQIVFSDTIAESLEDLCKDVKISMMNIASQFHLDFQKAHLLGGPSLIKNLGPFFTQRIEVASNPYRLFQTLGNLGFASDAQIEAVAGPAIALALEGAKKPRNPAVNLRKNEFTRKNLSFQKHWEKWRFTAQLAGVAFALVVVHSYLRDDFALQLADTSNFALKKTAKDVANLTGKNASITQINRYITTEEKRIAAMEKLAKVQEMNSALEVLKKINDIIPPKNRIQLDVLNFDINNSSVTIAGFVKDASQFELLRQALSTQAMNGQVKVNDNTRDSNRNAVRFSFNFEVSRNWDWGQK